MHSKVAADVEEYGWHVVKVLGDTKGPPWAYTIGLETTHRHPELVIFGLNLDLDLMHRVLNAMVDRIARGERFEHGMTKDGILDDYVCPFARFPKSAYDDHLGQAIDFHGSSDFRAVQCIWPDPDHALPWEKAAMLGQLARQPVFLRPDSGDVDPPWPFEEPHSRIVITSRQVATGQEPIRYAGRFDDGDWQFVCETTDDADDAVVATLGWVFDRDPSVRAAAALHAGQGLLRTDATAAWKPAP